MLDKAASDSVNESQGEQNLAEFELQAGRLPSAREHSDSAVHLAEVGKDDYRQIGGFGFRASAHFGLGEIATAEADFARATALEGRPLYANRGVRHSECRLLLGDVTGALSQTQANLEISSRTIGAETPASATPFWLAFRYRATRQRRLNI